MRQQRGQCNGCSADQSLQRTGMSVFALFRCVAARVGSALGGQEACTVRRQAFPHMDAVTAAKLAASRGVWPEIS